MSAATFLGIIAQEIVVGKANPNHDEKGKFTTPGNHARAEGKPIHPAMQTPSGRVFYAPRGYHRDVTSHLINHGIVTRDKHGRSVVEGVRVNEDHFGFVDSGGAFMTRGEAGNRLSVGHSGGIDSEALPAWGRRSRIRIRHDDKRTPVTVHEITPSHVVEKANPNHSKTNGQFTSATGVGQGLTHRDGAWRHHTTGELATPEHHEQLKRVGVSRGYSDVRFNNNPKHHVLAVALDSKGRGKTFYTKEFVAQQAAKKFERVRAFDKARPAIAAAVDAHLADPQSPHHDTAIALRLIERASFRPGSNTDTKAKVKAYGATTLRSEHVTRDGDALTFNFTGKKGVAISQVVVDKQLADLIGPRLGTPGPLFKTDAGKLRTFMHTAAKGGFHPKDLRTHNATRMALGLVLALGASHAPTDARSFRKAQMEVAAHVSKHLGNTPKMALDSYIDPKVWSRMSIKPKKVKKSADGEWAAFLADTDMSYLDDPVIFAQIDPNGEDDESDDEPMAKSFNELVAKFSPTPGDAHVPNAGGTVRGRRRRTLPVIVPTQAVGKAMSFVEAVAKMNTNHDAAGRFASGNGAHALNSLAMAGAKPSLHAKTTKYNADNDKAAKAHKLGTAAMASGSAGDHAKAAKAYKGAVSDAWTAHEKAYLLGQASEHERAASGGKIAPAPPTPPKPIKRSPLPAPSPAPTPTPPPENDPSYHPPTRIKASALRVVGSVNAGFGNGETRSGLTTKSHEAVYSYKGQFVRLSGVGTLWMAERYGAAFVRLSEPLVEGNRHVAVSFTDMEKLRAKHDTKTEVMRMTGKPLAEWTKSHARGLIPALGRVDYEVSDSWATLPKSHREFFVKSGITVQQGGHSRGSMGTYYPSQRSAHVTDGWSSHARGDVLKHELGHALDNAAGNHMRSESYWLSSEPAARNAYHTEFRGTSNAHSNTQHDSYTSHVNAAYRSRGGQDKEFYADMYLALAGGKVRGMVPGKEFVKMYPKMAKVVRADIKQHIESPAKKPPAKRAR